jgi:ribosome biogenesis GTPase
VPESSLHPASPCLLTLGWNRAFADALSTLAPDAEPGRVSRVDRGGALTLETAAGPLRARLGASLRHIADTAALPTVGDWVAVRLPRDGDLPTVEGVLPRQTAFLRRAAGNRTSAQVLAANVDTALLVCSLGGPLNVGRLERLLALTWDSGAEPIVVLSQSDRCADPEAGVHEVEFATFGVPVHPVSAVTGDGLAGLAPYVGPGRTSVLLGSSGAGKSTLANRLLDADVLATGALRRDGKGRHITSRRELLRLPSGGMLIDTPGLRSLGLWLADGTGREGFDDIEELAVACRFRDCAHDREPGCAVTAALADGLLPASRLERYRKLQRERAHLARQQDALLRRQENQRWRALTRALRTHPKPQDR